MTGEARSGTLVVPVEGVGNVSFSLIGGDSSIDAKVENDLPVFDVSIRADLDLYEIDGNIHQKYGLDMVEKMEEAANQPFMTDAYKQRKSCFGNINPIFSGLEEECCNHSPNILNQVQEWTSVYAQSTVNITVESDVRQEGQEINPL